MLTKEQLGKLDPYYGADGSGTEWHTQVLLYALLIEVAEINNRLAGITAEKELQKPLKVVELPGVGLDIADES